ncbi:class I adenylate-forming enzyme family protein [Saccharopolyspora sp. 5N708]|uniref:class I adenylate-forming enzyme family protein n=1 Tax=Saccharopolyspora sp. 5N708 TaxID=3457424 RepID=UPI003FD0D1FC
MTNNLAELLLEVADEHANREALVDGARRLDYAAMLRHAAGASARLAALGVEPGDRVAVLLPNGWRYAVGYFGIQLSGAIAVLVNNRLTTPEIEHVLSDSGARFVLTDDEFAARLPSGAIAIRDFATPREVPSAPPGIARRCEDVAHLLYTSGTTGRPKGAMQTHANLLFNAGTVRERLGAAPGERTLIAAPMFHATGTVSQFIGFIAAGGCCVLIPAFRAEPVLELLIAERITFFAGVAAMLRLLLSLERMETADLSALRLVVLGGSPVPETFPAEVAKQLPDLVLANVWGLTEATSIVTYVEGQEYQDHPWSAGKAVSGVELAISVDGAPPRDLRDRIGELCVRGPVVTAGYWGNPRATDETFVDGWLHTGDVGSIDAEGHVRVLDRLKDMIIRGGENVYSLEVENALATHPDVAEVAVVGVPDPLFDERVRAVVVPRSGSTPTVEDLRAHAAKRLADYKVPVEFRFVAELPRNPSGKVLKRSLAADD